MAQVRIQLQGQEGLQGGEIGQVGDGADEDEARCRLQGIALVREGPEFVEEKTAQHADHIPAHIGGNVIDAQPCLGNEDDGHGHGGIEDANGQELAERNGEQLVE
nr:hypothetical protein [Pseudoduganella albidiflava]